MAGQHFCKKCGKTMKDSEFYTSKNVEKYPPDGKMDLCKKCLTMHVDNWDPETFKWILQEIDVPYIKEEWDALLEKWAKDPEKVTGVTILGRYLSKMKLKQWSQYSWADTEALEEEARLRKINQMKAQGMTGEEIEAELATDRTPPKPKIFTEPQEAVGTPEYYDPSTVNDDFSDQLTEEDKVMLRLKWGRGYRPEEWVRLEQLYNDMMASYDIQGAGMKDTLIMICKTSLKSNQLLDAGDVDGAQKMIKMYDSLMKSAKLTAAQNKAESGEFVDSIGELVTICERDGPKDKVDKVLQDLQHYTRSLVTEEMNLGNMIDASVRAIAQDKEREAKIDVDDGDEEDSEIYSYPDDNVLSDEDYSEFEAMKQEEAEKDKRYLEEVR